MNLTATIYTRPDCHKCKVTRNVLVKAGVTVVEEQIDEHPDKLKLMQENGWNALPLVELDEGGVIHRWSDFSYDNLAAVKEMMKP